MPRSSVAVLGTCVAVILVYVASEGPAAWLGSRGLLPCHQFWAAFYRPLEWVMERSDVTDEWYTVYINKWRE